MTKAILNVATAAAIAVSTLGATAPAMAAGPVPAVAQSAESPVTEVSGKRHYKRGGFKHGFRRHHGKGGGFYLSFGKGKGGIHFGYRDCFRTKKVWTKFGWRWQRVRVC